MTSRSHVGINCPNCGASLTAAMTQCEFCETPNPNFNRTSARNAEEIIDSDLGMTGLLRKLLERYSREQDSLHVSPNIPPRVMQGAMKYAKTIRHSADQGFVAEDVASHELIAVIDLAMFGSAKHGIAFTNYGLNANSSWGSDDNSWKSGSFMDFSDIARAGDLKMTGIINKVSRNHDNSLVIDLGGPNPWIHNLLCEYQQVCRQCFP